MRAVELFAGVGGFRQGLQKGKIKIVWSNQWEPKNRRQWASRVYVKHFGKRGHTNEDIRKVNIETIPRHDLLVGGFPCQDYSVATTKAKGIRGPAGALWWRIYDILYYQRPDLVLLENVDRLLQSPRVKRGRHFGVLLWCFQHLGYTVEWRVINASDYGAAQRRRRVFIFATKATSRWGRLHRESSNPAALAESGGFFATAFPVDQGTLPKKRIPRTGSVPRTQKVARRSFTAAFGNAGIMVGRKFWARAVIPKGPGPKPLRDILQKKVPRKYRLRPEDLARWKYLKGAKAEKRVAPNGFEYAYAEGPLPFPDSIDKPSRTILTTEGGPSPSRFKHVVDDGHGLRRLTPREVEALNGFPPNWTRGIPEGWRYFCMGNALVVNLVARMGEVLLAGPPASQPAVAVAATSMAPSAATAVPETPFEVAA